jgi:hypothetical protein
MILLIAHIIGPGIVALNRFARTTHIISLVLQRVIRSVITRLLVPATAEPGVAHQLARAIFAEGASLAAWPALSRQVLLAL